MSLDALLNLTGAPSCKFTYASFTLAICYTVIAVSSAYLLFQLMYQIKRRPQKVFLLLLFLSATGRAVYFGLWPFKIFSDGCIPGIRSSTTLFFDILGTIPVCLLLGAFSLYVLTIARVNKLFQLYYNRYTPGCVITFYRALCITIAILNSIAWIATIADLAVPGKYENAKAVTYHMSVWSITLGIFVVALAFVYSVRSLYNALQAQIDSNTQQQQTLHDFDHDQNPVAMMDPTSSDYNAQLLAGQQSFNTYGSTRTTSSEANTTASAFSYGYNGRVALNKTRNPMRYLYIVAVISCLSFITKAILLLIMGYVLDDSKAESHPITPTLILFAYFSCSEILPSIFSLLAFRVVQAPTIQWQLTYDLADQNNNSNNNNNNNTNNHNNAASLDNLHISSSQPAFENRNMILSEIDDSQFSGSIQSNQNDFMRNTSSFNNTLNHNNNSSNFQSGGYHATVDSLVMIRQQQQQFQQQQHHGRYQSPTIPQQQQQHQQQQQSNSNPGSLLNTPTKGSNPHSHLHQHQSPSYDDYGVPQSYSSNIPTSPNTKTPNKPKMVQSPGSLDFDLDSVDFNLTGSFQGSSPSFPRSQHQQAHHTAVAQQQAAMQSQYSYTQQSRPSTIQMGTNRYSTQPHPGSFQHPQQHIAPMGLGLASLQNSQLLAPPSSPTLIPQQQQQQQQQGQLQSTDSFVKHPGKRKSTRHQQ